MITITIIVPCSRLNSTYSIMRSHVTKTFCKYFFWKKNFFEVFEWALCLFIDHQTSWSNHHLLTCGETQSLMWLMLYIFNSDRPSVTAWLLSASSVPGRSGFWGYKRKPLPWKSLYCGGHITIHLCLYQSFYIVPGIQEVLDTCWWGGRGWWIECNLLKCKSSLTVFIHLVG